MATSQTLKLKSLHKIYAYGREAHKLKKTVTASPSVIWPYQAQLGEGPVWDDQKQKLYWLDILGLQLLNLDTQTGHKKSLSLSHEVSAVALRTDGSLVAATGNGFALLEPDSGELTFLSDPESHIPTNRFNDGKCDSRGRFISGTMDKLETQATGSVYSLAKDFSVSPLFGKFIVSNGPAFSPDGQTLYFSNSAQREILKFDYNLEAGVVGEPVVFARIPDQNGFPDGLTVDAEGYVWCAHWDGWRLTRFAPNGTEERVVEFPVPRVTCPTFGGVTLDTLFVTTARTGLSDSDLSTAPLSGGLFAFKPGVCGLPTQRFAG